MAEKMDFDNDEQRSHKPYEAPRLVHLDHRATQSGTLGSVTDSYNSGGATTTNAPS